MPDARLRLVVDRKQQIIEWSVWVTLSLLLRFRQRCLSRPIANDEDTSPLYITPFLVWTPQYLSKTISIQIVSIIGEVYDWRNYTKDCKATIEIMESDLLALN